jgi:hypothetical protein
VRERSVSRKGFQEGISRKGVSRKGVSRKGVSRKALQKKRFKNLQRTAIPP